MVEMVLRRGEAGGTTQRTTSIALLPRNRRFRRQPAKRLPDTEPEEGVSSGEYNALSGGTLNGDSAAASATANPCTALSFFNARDVRPLDISGSSVAASLLPLTSNATTAGAMALQDVGHSAKFSLNKYKPRRRKSMNNKNNNNNSSKESSWLQHYSTNFPYAFENTIFNSYYKDVPKGFSASAYAYAASTASRNFAAELLSGGATDGTVYSPSFFSTINNNNHNHNLYYQQQQSNVTNGFQQQIL